VNVIVIGPWELAAATGFVVVSGLLAFAFRLGLTRSLVIATARTYLQLLALGLVLKWIFDFATPWLVVAILAVMILVATQTVASRLQFRAARRLTGTFAGMFLSGFTVTFAVTGLLIRVEPWYDPRYVIPIAGMVLGNSMNGIALSQERLFDGLRNRRAEVQLCLSLGASAWEASLPLIRDAFRAGMIPTLNAMTTVGIVSIPGMMTGQMLAGVDPTTGAGYQIVVMLMLSAATAAGSIISLTIAFRHAFDREERLRL
jgi:putative ABC transport system permease protein